MESVFVSVIVPCYNQELYISETLESIYNQNFRNFECIIVDDGSTDNSRDIIERFCTNDKRFKYFYQKNQGLSSARNTAIKNSQGKYILPLDSDDLISKTYIAEAVNVLEENDNISIVYSNAKFFGKRNHLWKLPDFDIEMMLARNLIFCSAVFRKSDYLKTSGYNINMKYGLEDWDFWLSILALGGEVFKLEKIHFFYRIRGNSMLRSLTSNKNSLLRRQVWLNNRGLYADFFYDPQNSFEYLTLLESYEYRLGKVLLKPVRYLLKKYHGFRK